MKSEELMIDETHEDNKDLVQFHEEDILQRLDDNDILDLYRLLHPRARRTRATAIIRNGSKRTVYGCVCGAQHTCATAWRGRDSRHVADWRYVHEKCLRACVIPRLRADWAKHLETYRARRRRRVPGRWPSH